MSASPGYSLRVDFEDLVPSPLSWIRPRSKANHKVDQNMVVGSGLWFTGTHVRYLGVSEVVLQIGVKAKQMTT